MYWYGSSNGVLSNKHFKRELEAERILKLYKGITYDLNFSEYIYKSLFVYTSFLNKIK